MSGRPHSVRLAVLVYSGLVLIAVAWGLLDGTLAGWFPVTTAAWRKTACSGGIGLAIGLVVVALSRLSLRCFSWSRELYDWFGEVLGPLSVKDALLLACLSSIGEEIFFRGAMQPTCGLWITTAFFALLHFPPRLQLWPWTLLAGLLGLAFGYLVLWSGNLLGPMVAHFVINALNLIHLRRFLRAAEKLPGDASLPSMSPHEPNSHPDARGCDRLPGGDGGER